MGEGESKHDLWIPRDTTIWGLMHLWERTTWIIELISVIVCLTHWFVYRIWLEMWHGCNTEKEKTNKIILHIIYFLLLNYFVLIFMGHSHSLWVKLSVLWVLFSFIKFKIMLVSVNECWWDVNVYLKATENTKSALFVSQRLPFSIII